MKKILWSIVALIATASLWAVPAYRGWQTKTQPDGSTIEVRQMGDEFYHYWETSDGKQVEQNAEGKWESVGEAPSAEEVQALRAKAAQHRQRKVVGTEPNLAPRGVVILANFADSEMESSHTLSVFNELCNSENCTVNKYNGINYGSAAQYFADQSNNSYRPVFDVFGPVTLSHNTAYYGGNYEYTYEGKKYSEDSLATDAVIEACILANQQYSSLNFANYDSDNDGYVDFVYVIYAGKGEADPGSDKLPNTIWPHNYSIQEVIAGVGVYFNVFCHYKKADTKIDGKYLDNYACSSELAGSGSMSGIGTLCHEFGHVMGLPDLYDTEYGDNYENGVTPGDWNIMDGGSYNGGGHCPPNYDPWEKYFFGWEIPENLGATGQNITLYANGTSNYQSYQINSANTLQAATKEGLNYYIENRQKSGWDSYVPTSGMLVWKVNFNASVWKSNSPNNTSGSPRYTIVPADGKTKNYGASGDTYPTGSIRSCTPISGHEITDITKSGNNITFKYNGGEVNYWTYGFEGTNCTITGEASGQVDKGAALNLTITPNAGYTLSDADCWAVEMGSVLLEYGTGFTFNEGTGAFSIASMTGNVYIIATAKEVPATITWMDKGETFTTTQTSAGKLVLPENEPEACERKVFYGWTATANYSSEDTAPTIVKAGDDASATTYYAVFATAEGGSQTETYGFENTDDATNWTIDNEIIKNSTMAASGSYSGKINTDNTHITYNNKINVTNFSFKLARNSNNNNYNVYIETSTDKSNWTAAETYSMSSFSNGSFTSKSKDFDGTKELYVRFRCYNTTAERFVDDISVTYGGTTYTGYTTSCVPPTEVTVTFDKNSGEGSMDAQTIPYNEATALSACTFTKEGHTFIGWATTADGAVVYADEAEVTLKKNITLFAKWSINSYAINLASVSNGTISTSPAENANFGTTVTVTATPNTHYTLGAISVVDANEQAVQLTGNTFTMPANNVTVSATFNEKATHTIRFFDNGVQVGADQVVHLDDTPEVPANPTPCDDEYTFVGWATSAITTETTEAPTTVSNFTVTGAQDYYAVYSRTEEGEGNGMFDGKTVGTYKIYAQVGETKYYAQGTGSKINSTTNEANATEYTIEAVTGGFAIKTGTTYITYNSSTDLGTSTSSYKWTFTSGTKGTWRVNSSTSGRAWIFRAGSTNKFGGYSTSNVTSDGDYYDLEISGGVNSTTYYTTAPDCSGEVYTITLDAGENGSLASSHETAKAGKTITITATPDQYFHLATITANDGAVELSGEGNTRTFTMPASDVTVSATFAEDDKYTIRFICEGEQIKVQELHLGQTADKPADPKASCDDYTFAGWWTAELAADNKEAKTWVTNFTVDDNQDYYAIFSKTETSEGGASATVTFATESSDTDISDNVSGAVESSIGISSVSGTKVFTYADYGVRIGSGSYTGSIILSLNPAVTTNTITVDAKKYGSDGGSLSVKVNDDINFGSAQQPSASGGVLTFTRTNEVAISSVTVATSSKRAYIKSITVGNGSSSTTYYSSTVNCGETGVEQTCTVSPASKVLQNGQIFILREGRTYTLTGNLVK